MSGVQFGPKWYALFKNQTSAQHEFDLKSQVWFQTKIAWLKVQLLFCYITKFSGSDTGFPSLYKYFVDPVVSWFVEIWKQSCFSFSRSFIILVSLNKQLVVPSQWSFLVGQEKDAIYTKKMVRFAKNQWEPSRLQGSPVISKWIQ